MALHSRPKGLKRWLAVKALDGAEKKLRESRYKNDPALLQTVANLRQYLDTGHSNY
jgi:hypothetical protein